MVLETEEEDVGKSRQEQKGEREEPLRDWD